MSNAGYKIEFASEEIAKDAAVICDKAAEGTTWQGKAEIYRNNVFVKTRTPAASDGFEEEDIARGETLFQKVCFAVSRAFPEEMYNAMCHFTDNEEHITLRLSSAHTGEYLRFFVRETTPVRFKFWSMEYTRRPDGTFWEKPFVSMREKAR